MDIVWARLMRWLTSGVRLAASALALSAGVASDSLRVVPVQAIGGSGAVELVAVLSAQAAPIANGPYTTVQAERGRILYEQRCSACHGSSLRGGANEYSAPALAGPHFYEKWNDRPLEDLFLYTAENMPPGETPLPSATCLDITAYILQVLKYPPGAAELTADSPTMKLRIERRP